MFKEEGTGVNLTSRQSALIRSSNTESPFTGSQPNSSCERRDKTDTGRLARILGAMHTAPSARDRLMKSYYSKRQFRKAATNATLKSRQVHGFGTTPTSSRQALSHVFKHNRLFGGNNPLSLNGSWNFPLGTKQSVKPKQRRKTFTQTW